MNRELELVRAPAVVLRRCDHPPGVAHRDPERERATSHGVHFVERGQFRVRTIGAWRDLTTATLLVTTPELELSFEHGEAHPTDTCLSVTFSDAAIESARALGVLDATPVRQLTNRLAFLRRALAESPTTEAASRRSAASCWPRCPRAPRASRCSAPIASPGMPRASIAPSS